MARAILKVAPPWDQALVDAICQGFTEKLGEEISFQVEEDPSLIGGFLAQIHGNIYDVSFSTQLGALRCRLAEHWGGDDGKN